MSVTSPQRAKFDSIEIWADPLPNDQLVLVWLLDLLRPYKDITSKLSLVHTDDKAANYAPESVAKWKLPAFKVTESHLVMASRAWKAYRAQTFDDGSDDPAETSTGAHCVA